MDIRFSNRWGGFSREEIIILLNAVEWYMVEKDKDCDGLVDEMDYELRRRGEANELAWKNDGEKETGKASSGDLE